MNWMWMDVVSYKEILDANLHCIEIIFWSSFWTRTTSFKQEKFHDIHEVTFNVA